MSWVQILLPLPCDINDFPYFIRLIVFNLYLRRIGGVMLNKLNVQDYVFECNGEDLKNAKLKCTFKNDGDNKQIIFEISAQNENNGEYSL